MDRFEAMRVFCAVIEAGGFAAAAERLGVSTTAVSRHVSQLEAHLNVRLINRTTRRMSPTDEGFAYFERCTQLLADLEETETSVSGLARRPRGRLRLTAPIALATLRLAPAFAEFSRRYPDITLDLVLSDSVSDFAEEGLDMAIRVGRVGSDNLVARRIGETTVLARAGGAPTLAVGIAQILHNVLPGENTMAFWYHFAILFEALFILTAVDAGTRAARFMLQDLLGVISPNLKRTDSLPANLIATALCVLAWGYFLHQGVVDPLGGINTLWPLFGIANQMLAGMALMLCAVVLFKMKRQRYAWVALVPTAWLLICTLTAGWQKAFSPDNKVGFLAIANKFQAMIDSGKIPAQYTESQLSQLVFNNRLDAGLTIFFMVVVVVLALYSLRTALAALKVDAPTAKETPYEPMPENLEEIVTQAKGAH